MPWVRGMKLLNKVLKRILSKIKKDITLRFSFEDPVWYSATYNSITRTITVYLPAVLREAEVTCTTFEDMFAVVITHEVLHHVLETYVGVFSGSIGAEVTIDLVAQYSVLGKIILPRYMSLLFEALFVHDGGESALLAVKLRKLLSRRGTE